MTEPEDILSRLVAIDARLLDAVAKLGGRLYTPDKERNLAGMVESIEDQIGILESTIE